MAMITKKKLLGLSGLALTTALTSVSFQAMAQQAWTGGTTEYSDSGVNAVVTTPTATSTYINQTGQLTIYSTPNSNVGLNETVTVGQDNISSHFVMKANNGAAVTSILGNVLTRLKDGAGNATAARGGLLTVLDTNGIFFGANSMIDAGGIVASTGSLRQNKLINDGEFQLRNFVAGTSVEIEAGASITVADGGLAAFVAPTVINRGVITANMGRVELAGVNTRTTIDLYGDGLLEFAVNNNNADALSVLSTGDITAEGGIIHMTTGAAQNLVDSVINTSGINRVESVTSEGGKIILGGKKTKKVITDGQLLAQGQTDGGTVTINATDEIDMATTTVVNASGATGTAGKLGLNTADATLDSDTNTVVANALNTFTNVDVSASRDVMVMANLIWTGEGHLVIDANRDLTLGAEIRSNYNNAGDNNASLSLKAGRNFKSDTSSNRAYAFTKSGDLLIDAGRDIRLGGDNGRAVLVQADTGDVTLNAGRDVRLRSVDGITGVTSISGDIAVSAGRNTVVRGGTTANDIAALQALDGDLAIDTGDMIIRDGSVVSADATVKGNTVTITRSSDGTVGLGDRAGDLQLSQNEINEIETASLIIGRSTFGDNAVTDMEVENVDFSAIDNVTLNSLDNPNDGGSDLWMFGTNIFANANLNARDDVSFRTGSDNTFNGNVNANAFNGGNGSREVNVDGVVNATGAVTFVARDNIDVNQNVSGASIDLQSAKVELNADLDAATLTGTATMIDVESNAAQIQDGIDVAAAAGATVNVGAGAYVEAVNVNKSVNLRGAQAGVDARNRTGVLETEINPNSPGFNVTADNVVIDGFDINGGNPGINVANVDNVQLLNNIVRNQSAPGNSDDGIALDNVTNVTIRQNWVKDNGDEGIYGKGNLNNLLVQNNLVEDTRNNGIEVVNASGTITIDDNTINRAGLNGVFVNQTDGVVVTNNKINSDADTNNSINVRGSDNTRVIDNEIDGGPVGILVDGGLNNLIDDNDVENFTDTGIIVTNNADGTDVTDNFIQSTIAGSVGVFVDNVMNTVVGGIGNALRNRVYDVDTAVNVNGGTNTKVEGNDIRRADTGVQATNAGTLNVLNNMIADSIVVGANITSSDNARLIDNEITNGNDGIIVTDTTGVFVDDNDVTNFSGKGIVLVRSTDGDVIDNFIQSTQAGATGIEVEGGSLNQIGGDGNALRNRVYDVDTGVMLSGDTSTTIDGNDFRRSDVGVLANNVAGTSDQLAITDNTFAEGTRAVRLLDATNVLVGGTGDTNTITGFLTGVSVSGGQNIDIDDNIIRNVTNGIAANNVSQLNIEDNQIDGRFNIGGKGDFGIYVANSFNAQIGGFGTGNEVEDFETGIRVISSTTADVEYNDIEEFTLNAIRVSGSRYIDVIGNDIDNNFRGTSGNGINVSSSNDAEINNNFIDDLQSGAGIVVASSSRADIKGNQIHDTSWDGINVSGGNNAYIYDNHIHRTGADGIDVDSNAYVEIDNNEVYDADDNGIEVSASFDANITNNDVRRSGDDGIELTTSLVADVRGNTVTDAGGDGIDVFNIGTYNGFGVDIVDNTVNGSGSDQDGIAVFNVASVDVEENTIYRAGRDGINVNAGNNADIKDNKILGTNGGFLSNGVNGAGRDGIHVINSSNVEIHDNDILAGTIGFFSVGGQGAANFGIYADNTYNVDVKGNEIKGRLIGAQATGNDAIRVEDSSYADIYENDIFRAGNDGIHVKRSFAVDIDDNIINAAGDDGIDVESSRFADIRRNTVNLVTVNGIEVSNGNDANVENNVVGFIGQNGIDVNGVDRADILLNTVSFTGGNGIVVGASDETQINNNNVSSVFGNGIQVSGGDRATLRTNTIDQVGSNGIMIENTTATELLSNTVTNSVENGIELNETDNALLFGNVAEDNGAAGILVNGATGTNVITNTLNRNDNGIEIRGSKRASSNQTLLSGNFINDNVTSGVKTSGDTVGLVGMAGNQLDGNAIGFLLEGGEIDISNFGSPNRISGGTAGMRFDGDNVRLVNNTLGTTIFENIGGNYIELANGALFNPGTPTIIDGLAVSWDGVIALNSPLGAGILTATQRRIIESRIVDFDDNVTLGQILVGLTPDLSEEDILALGLFSLSPDAGNVNVIFRGLPPVSTPSISALAALAPAAGDSAEDLANLEPAAGGQEGCWASASAGGAGGEFEGTVSFTFGGDIESAIGDSGCAGTDI
jgi:parallel beta-helix repeat protein